MAAGLGSRFVEALATTKLGSALNPLRVNPLELFTMEQGHKLAHTSPSGFMDAAKKYFQGYDTTVAAHMTEGKIGYTFGFEGGLADASIASTRQIAGGIAAGYAALSALDINPVAGLATLGMHGVIGMGMLGMGGNPRRAGMAYLGVTAVNAFRSGNNMGPM